MLHDGLTTLLRGTSRYYTNGVIDVVIYLQSSEKI